MQDSLSTRIKRGTAWGALTTTLVRGLQFIAELFLAHLLMPEDFGLMAMAMAVIQLSEGTTMSGFESALIQRQEVTGGHLNAAWTVELARNLALALLLFALAPLFGNYFNEPRATAILRVLTLTFLMMGLKNIGVVYFRKELRFEKQFLLEVIPLVSYLVVVLPLAWVIRNVWALVGAMLARRLMVLIASYVLHPYRPKLHVKLSKVKELFLFGKWILGSSILSVGKKQGIVMFIGGFFGLSLLGYYNRAELFSTFLFLMIGEIIWKVGYPAYALVQNDAKKLKQIFLGTLYLATFVALPIVGTMLVMGSDIIVVLMTEKWLPSVPLTKLLCLLGLGGLLLAPFLILFQAIGRPSVGAKAAALDLLFVGIGAYPSAYYFGVQGFIILLTVGIFLLLGILIGLARKPVGYRFSELIRPALFAAVHTAIMISILLMLRLKIVTGTLAFPGLMALLASAVLVYLALVLVSERYLGYGLLTILSLRRASSQRGLV